MNNSHQPLAHPRLIILCLIGMAVILQACDGGLLPIAAPTPASLPVATVAPVATLPGHLPVAQPTRTSLPAAKVASPAMPHGQLFADDFSNPSSGWDVRNNADAFIGYKNSEFVISVGKINTTLWSIPNHYLTDVSVEVDAREVAGPDDNLFGVICRYQDANNFYRFVIAGNGYAGITKRAGGKVTVISSPKLTRSPAVVRGQASNHIKAICQSNQLSLLVNNQLVAQAIDSDFQGGDVGLLASAGNHPGVEIHFTHFVVLQP